MNTKLKKILVVLIITCFLTTMFFGASGCHRSPMFVIGNEFPETVTVYFNGHNMGKLNSMKTKNFWPNDTAKEDDLLIEFKSKSGELLFSKTYTMDDIIKIVEDIHANPYWIGPETK